MQPSYVPLYLEQEDSRVRLLYGSIVPKTAHMSCQRGFIEADAYSTFFGGWRRRAQWALARASLVPLVTARSRRRVDCSSAPLGVFTKTKSALFFHGIHTNSGESTRTGPAGQCDVLNGVTSCLQISTITSPWNH